MRTEHSPEGTGADRQSGVPSLLVQPGSVRIVIAASEAKRFLVTIERGGADFDAAGGLIGVELLSFAHRIPGLKLDAHALRALAEQTGCNLRYIPNVDVMEVHFTEFARSERSDWGAATAEVGEDGSLLVLTVEAEFERLALPAR